MEKLGENFIFRGYMDIRLTGTEKEISEALALLQVRELEVHDVSKNYANGGNSKLVRYYLKLEISSFNSL